MSDDSFGPLELAFFAAGDAYDEHGEDSASDQEVYVETERGLRLSLTVLGARLAMALAAARRRVVLQVRILELRVAVAVSTCAEQALQGTAFRGAGARPVGPRVPTFIPRLARSPVLVRASIVVLVFTAATFPTAAVLAATGAI